MKIFSGQSNLELAEEIAKFIGGKSGVSIVNQTPRPGEVLGFTLDSSAIGKLGFVPQVKFWDGLNCYLTVTKSKCIFSANLRELCETHTIQ